MKRREVSPTAASAALSAEQLQQTPQQQQQQQQQQQHGQVDAVGASAPAASSTSSQLHEAALPPMVSLGSSSGSSGRQLVKKRRTKNSALRDDMTKARGSIDVHVPPLEPQTFASWDEFIHAWGEYMSATKTLYRRRSSSTTPSWNSKNRFKKLPVPDSFQYATMAYWCTHGCIQPSRGTGVRAHLHNRFTGCTARITADVVYETTEDNDVRWFIRVRNQIAQHNHRISDEIYQCYTNNSSVPDELLLGSSEELAEDQAPSSPTHSPVMRSFESAEETEFENSSRILAELEAEQVYKLNPRAQMHSSALAAKEALMDERKLHMVRSELQPILIELKQTSARVIHKRLQDVSEVVAHLLSKWQRDREIEEQILSSARAALTGGSTTEEDDQEHPPREREQTSPPSPPGIYGDGPGAILPHRLDSFPGEPARAGAASALPNDMSAAGSANCERSGGSSASAVPVDGNDDELSRHRGQSELV